MQQSAGGCPPVSVVERGDRAMPALGGEVGGGEFVGVYPADEGGGLVAVSAGGIGQPAVEVGLPEGGQGEVVGVEPVEECLGCATVGAHAQGLLSSGRAPVVAGAQTPEQVPDQVAVQGIVAMDDVLGVVVRRVARGGVPAVKSSVER